MFLLPTLIILVSILSLLCIRLMIVQGTVDCSQLLKEELRETKDCLRHYEYRYLQVERRRQATNLQQYSAGRQIQRILEQLHAQIELVEGLAQCDHSLEEACLAVERIHPQSTTGTEWCSRVETLLGVYA